MNAADRTGLEGLLVDARARTLDLVSDLDGDRLFGPRIAIVNPVLWEIGHVAWFQERWVMRHLRGEAPLRSDGDQLYDSAKVAHDTRWDLPLPDRVATFEYMQATLERSIEALRRDSDRPGVEYFYKLALFHEDMHDEAFTYTRQTLGYAAPALRSSHDTSRMEHEVANRVAGDVSFDGGRLLLGAPESTDGFVFDNEKWAHPVSVAPFAMSRTAVTNGEFRDFVEDAGYARRELWTEGGWAWRQSAGARHPVYWRRDAEGRWQRRVFDRWLDLEPDLALVHVNWYEADAFCRWAKRRLPTEPEWEWAATYAPGGAKRRFPWGDAPPQPERAHLESAHLDVVPVAACAAGDSAAGCRQLWGNVWEWTATPFQPYPGFVADPYTEYSQPWFDGRHMVLRGGCWATRTRLLRNTWRNFYTRERRDVFAGFRTCAAGDVSG